MLKTMMRMAPLLAVLPLAACEDLGLDGEESVSLSFATSAQASSATSASLIPITDGVHTLDVQNVDVIFEEIVLERSESQTGGDSDGDSDADSDSDGPSNEKFRTGAVTIALPLQGGVITPIDAALPTGLYEEIELDIASVRVRGTWDGQPFDATIAVNEELEMDFSPPFEITSDADRLNITVVFNTDAWFRSGATLIDPRALLTDESLRSQVRSNIRASLDAFEDSDQDADDQDSDSDND